MSNHNQDEQIFRRKFPLGYFLHYDPCQLYFSANYDSSPPSCGQILFVFELLTLFFRSHYSYMKTDSTGLTLYWHPNQTLNIRWDEVLRLERKKFLSIFPYEELYVDRPFFFGKHKPIYLTENIKKHFEQKKFSIPLRLYMGWPKGKLAEELIRFIPDIINKSPN